MPIVVGKILRLSPVHITEADARLLDEAFWELGSWPRVSNWESRLPPFPCVSAIEGTENLLGSGVDGWRVSLAGIHTSGSYLEDAFYAELADMGFSDEFRTLLKEAVREECILLEIDIVTPMEKGRPRFDWCAGQEPDDRSYDDPLPF